MQREIIYISLCAFDACRFSAPLIFVNVSALEIVLPPNGNTEEGAK